MKLSLQWLHDFVKLPKSVSASDLADKLTNHTVEVEGVEYQREAFSKVIVGKVISVAKHPNADRLRLAKVDVRSEILDIVCGAPNLEEGQLVAVALIGAILPGGLEIRESEIRGEKSFGMICAEDELGLGQNHEGIMVLSKKAKVGQDFSVYLGLDDTILEIDNKSLSNRSDLWGHYGLAREVSVFYDLKFPDYEEFCSPEIIGPFSEKLDIKIEDSILCPYYSALKIINVTVKDSPKWLKQRLLAVGMRPINNLVDATNYVMLELGQPLHAFSAEKVNRLVVRRAKKDESIETLDDKEHALDSEILVIANSDEPVAVAGVIGGGKTGIHDGTKEIILESANFEAVAVRKAAAKIGVRTDSSVRFEKSLDPNFCPLALRRALKIIQETCPKAEVLAYFNSGSTKIKSEEIKLKASWLDEKIGETLGVEKYVNILRGLGFAVEIDGDILKVLVPTWRAAKDVKIAEDLLEEIVRIYGYNNIKISLPKIEMVAPKVLPEKILEDKLKTILAFDNALHEVYNYSFVGENQLNKLNIDPSSYLHLVNPISSEHTMLRQSLAPNLISNARTNQFKYDSFGLFEIGRVFIDISGNNEKGGESSGRLPYQEKNVSFVIAGGDNVFSRAKGVVENILFRISSGNVGAYFLPGESFPGFADHEKSARIMVGSEELGLVALLAKDISKTIGLKKESVIVEMSFNSLLEIFLAHRNSQYLDVSKYPAVKRDLAFVVDTEVLYNDLRESIASFDPLINSVELFDVYQGTNLPAEKKSLAFSVSYLSKDRTLTTEEVDSLQGRLLVLLAEKFGAQIRNY
ncbi:MAG: phenylalanine--tRNA ligase subunit beta [Candidatus Falkowbacteria bacterium]|nr:phenylalanine--tRNA ligase subunit beta [Candidatus Falkowbacteria bacterium]